jgi:xanthine dehydrogenase YagS FAD-binding subunit
MDRFAWVAAGAVEQAVGTTTAAQAMVAPQAGQSVLMAGGVDVLDLMKEGLLAPGAVVSLAAIPGLGRVDEDAAGGLRLGAMATLADLAVHPIVQARYPALADVLANAASPQIRNRATLGGNLLQRPRCWYFRSAAFHCLKKGGGHCFAISGENQYHAIFDNRPCAIVHPSTAATVLAALGAVVELDDAHGAVRQVRLEDFFVSPETDVHRENDLKPQEVMTAVLLPKTPPGRRMAFLKQGETAAFDWPLADVAVVLDLDPEGVCQAAAVVLGAAAATPHRARAAEAVLTGRRIDQAAAQEAGRAALAGATPLAKNAYKLPLFETLVRRAILAAAAAP